METFYWTVIGNRWHNLGTRNVSFLCLVCSSGWFSSRHH